MKHCPWSFRVSACVSQGAETTRAAGRAPRARTKVQWCYDETAALMLFW